MRQEHHISDADLAAALKSPIPDPRHDAILQSASGGRDGAGQYFQEEVRKQLFALFGAERVLQGGLRVYSTYDRLSRPRRNPPSRHASSRL